MSGVKPILNRSSEGFWIDTETRSLMITKDGVTRNAINSDFSSIIDIALYNNVVLSPESLDEWLKLYGYGSILNQYILNDCNLLTIGTNGDVYGIAISDESGIREIKCIVNGSNWNQLEQGLTQLLTILNDCESRISDALQLVKERRTISGYVQILEDVYRDGYIAQRSQVGDIPLKQPIKTLNIEWEDRIQEPIQLVRDQSLSDYISFRNLVRDTGKEEFVFVMSHDVYYDNVIVYRDYTNHPYPAIGDKELADSIAIDPMQPLRYDIYEKKKIYERIVGAGDIIDITVAYRKLPDPNDKLTEVQYENRNTTTTGNAVLYDGPNVLFEESGIHNLEVRVASSIIEVRNTETGVRDEIVPSRVKIGDDILIEVSTDGLVVYSLNENIVEYFIRSCRLLHDASEYHEEYIPED